MRRFVQLLGSGVLAAAAALAGTASPGSGAQAQVRVAAGGARSAATAPAARRTSAGSPLPSICRSGPGLASCYTMSITVTGAVSARGTSSEPEDYPCKRYLAETAGGGTEAPLPEAPLEDYRYSFSANLENFKGPGTYPMESSTTEGGHPYFTAGLVAGSTSYGPLEAGHRPATGSAVVRSNGSVSITFKNLRSSGHSSKTVSGTAQYTCQDI